MATRLRLSQPRYARHFRDGYRPEIPSDGLTIDTPVGPVDLVAIERILTGCLTPVTNADISYVTALLPSGRNEYILPVAAGLGITPDAVQRAHERRKAESRSEL
jgi:hypothetical protein